MKIEFAEADLEPLVKQVVAEALRQVESDRAKLDGRISFTEPEAASLLGVKRHVLRDARLRGEVEASRIGARVVYTRDALLAYIARNRLR
jgi:hypothetical protein